jgi:hypothetical protein
MNFLFLQRVLKCNLNDKINIERTPVQQAEQLFKSALKNDKPKKKHKSKYNYRLLPAQQATATYKSHLGNTDVIPKATISIGFYTKLTKLLKKSL